MNKPKIMIAAPKSGSGKTLVTCALICALKKRGIDVTSIKCGPDYIDPMFHRSVLGIFSSNLDTYFTDESTTKSLYYDAVKNHEFCVMEGVMGLFDGVGGIKPEGSSYNLACVTRTPIVLVVDTKGQARSVVPIIKGFCDYDKENLIKGIILNRMSEPLYKELVPLIKEVTQVPVLGYFPEHKDLNLESRHLGLKMPEEVADIESMLSLAGDRLSQTVDIDGVVEIAKKAEAIDTSSFLESIKRVSDISPVIAVARDEAFCFYYDINLRMLEAMGAKLVYFSPLKDSKLPEDINGLLLGGGYPELYAKELSDNQSMRESIHQAILSGVATFAECGGFMYLNNSIMEGDKKHSMVGIVDADVKNKGRLVRFGYIELSEMNSRFLGTKGTIKGHEFHYYDSENNGNSCVAKKPSGVSWDCVVSSDSYWLGFPHLYFPSNPDFAKNLVRLSLKHKKSH